MKMNRRVLRVNMMLLVWAFQIWLIATAHAGVVSTSPASNAVNVATSIATINVEFDDDAYVNYVTEGSFIVKPLAGFDPPAVSGVKSYSIPNTVHRLLRMLYSRGIPGPFPRAPAGLMSPRSNRPVRPKMPQE